MYIYNFSKDLRIGYLKDYLKSISKHIETGIWENEFGTLEKARNGLYQVIEFYFGLSKGSSNTHLILQGKEDLVIKDFIKKFQYPNPRDTRIKAMPEIVDNKQNINPLRIMVKFLYRDAVNKGKMTSTITTEQFSNYILTNPSTAEGSENISELDEFIRTTPNPLHELDFEYYGGAGDKKRFIRELLQIAGELPFLDYTPVQPNDGKLTLDFSNLDDDAKYMLGDILTSNEKWNYPENFNDRTIYRKKDIETLYKEYMQVIPNFVVPDNIDIELGHSNGNETNVIYYGAPGTGKSFRVNEVIKNEYINYDESSDSEYVFRTTIHNDYSYYDFVGQIMPITDVTNKNKIRYEFYPGIFTNALTKAYTNPDKKVFLVLEEMSRGNITSIFGDIFQLLDRNLQTGISEFGITNKLLTKEIFNEYILKNEDLIELEKQALILTLDELGFSNKFIKIPGNLYIYGTLNTSDQSVFPMDAAFKRRFSLKYVSLDPEVDVNKEPLNNFIFKLGNDYIRWVSFYLGVNEFINENSEVSEDKFIGQFFIKGKNFEDVSEDQSEYIDEDELVKIRIDGIEKNVNIKDVNYNTSQIKDKLLNYLFNDVENHIRITNSANSIFKKEKASFSNIYTDFNNGINVFSDKLMQKIKVDDYKENVANDTNEDLIDRSEL